MTTAAPHKTHFATTWTADKIQLETARTFARQMKATMPIIQKLGPEAMAQYQAALNTMKAEHYKKLGAKTPIELVKHMAEFEANVFGSIINVWGDEKEAHLEYEVCGCWNAMQHEMQMTKECGEQMGQMFQSCVASMAKELGFKGSVKFGNCEAKEPAATITITR